MYFYFFDNFTHLKSDIEKRGRRMDNFFELRKIEENKRGGKCFISVISGMRFNGLINIEKYVAVRKVLNHFTLEIFSTNFDLIKIKDDQKKFFYLGDDNSYSYYLLNFIVSKTELKSKTEGITILINGKIYLPLPLAHDLCTDEISKKLLEKISQVNI